MDFKGKKVAVIGVGVEGKSTLNYLEDKNAKLFLLDQKETLDPEIITLAKSIGVQLHLGKNYLETVDQFDLIFRSPGVRPDLPELLRAKEAGVRVTSQTKYFFDTCPCPIVGVTGTKGKGTTATLIFEMLKADGRKVFLGGNIGQAPLDFLQKLTGESIVVLELSSFQLIDLEKSPQVGVVLMITSEHLDWHQNTSEYIEAKKPIVKYQSERDFALVNVDYPTSKEFLAVGGGHKIAVSTKEKLEMGVFIEKGIIYRNLKSPERVVQVEEVGLIGPHNLENIVAAVGAASVLEVPLDSIVQVVKEFKGLEHRLEFIRETAGVKFYNDSFSTTPETAIAAIRSFSEPEILILGGSSKNSDFMNLGKEIISRENLKALILIGQEGPRIKKAINTQGEFKGQILEGAKSMEEIISQARDVADSGDIVLLSPACASFDMFKNYKERGELFKKEVMNLSLRPLG